MLLAVAVCVVLVGVISQYEKNAKWIEIDPNDYLKVTTTGYDGYNGEYKLSWNTKGAEERVVDALENCISIEIVKAEDEVIVNGQQKVFNLTVDEKKLKEKRVTLSKYYVEFTIDGLEEMKELDVFQYVEAVVYYNIPKGVEVNHHANEWWWKSDTPEFILNSDIKVTMSIVNRDFKNSTAVVELEIKVSRELYDYFYSMGYYLKEIRKNVEVELIEYIDTI